MLVARVLQDRLGRSQGRDRQRKDALVRGGVDGHRGRREASSGQDLRQQPTERVSDDRRLLVERPDHGGVVIGHLTDRLVGEHLGMGLGLLDGLRVVGPARGQRGEAGVGEDPCPTVPAAREQPQAVNEDDRRLARCVRLVDLTLFFSGDRRHGVYPFRLAHCSCASLPVRALRRAVFSAFSLYFCAGAAARCDGLQSAAQAGGWPGRWRCVRTMHASIGMPATMPGTHPATLRSAQSTSTPSLSRRPESTPDSERPAPAPDDSPRPRRCTMARAKISGTATCTCRIRTAPTSAPMNMAATEIRRRPDFDPFPPPSALSAAIPVTVRVSTVVVRSGTANRRTLAFCTPMARARNTMSA